MRRLLSVQSAGITVDPSAVPEGNPASLMLSATTDTGDDTYWEITVSDADGNQVDAFNTTVPGAQAGELPNVPYPYTFPGDEGASYDVNAKVYDEGS
ncbi:MAG TPA: hypothetical protein VLJ39_00335, partial [Tepidisphaeraceae bacterium]|nr:hypothetical protein [Tepidisphaeraceae bacterium]